MTKLTYLFVCINLICSCGIYTFTGADINVDAKTISIPFFQNQASLVQPTLSYKFTDALQDRFIQQTNLNSVRTNGDLHFEGYISEYQVKPISISSNDQANQNRLTIKVFVRFDNKLDDDKSFEQSFSRYADFDSSLNLSSVEEGLIDEIITELIEDIFNKAVVNW